MEIHKIEESIAYKKKKPNAERATIMWNGRIRFNNTAQLLGTIEIHRRFFDVIIGSRAPFSHRRCCIVLPFSI